MQKAKEQILEMRSQFQSDHELTDEERTSLKLQINDMLFINLPSDITVSDMETLAFTIFDIVVNPKTYLNV